MAEQHSTVFEPDYAIHPGEMLEETLAARGIKKSEFAEMCELSPKTVSQIINGKAPVSPENAIGFERVLGVSANVWSNLDAHYRLHHARSMLRKGLEQRKAWAASFPVKELTERGYLPPVTGTGEKVEALLDFFGVSSIKAFKTRFQKVAVAYRKSPAFKSSPESVAAWLRICELRASDVTTKAYDRQQFKKALVEIRSLTGEEPEVFEPRMKEFCWRVGVTLVLASELPKTRLSGATRWLNPNKALIMLSLRHKTDDHFWFTFFHQAGHLLLHGKRDVFIDEPDMQQNAKEREADRFASNVLIPSEDYELFAQRSGFSRRDILSFACEQGIAPGIVVGRLQHDGFIEFRWHNKLKRRFVLIEST